ncbi:beta-ketoacyl-ACP synthase [Sandaracinus amylolyticus]|uniref:beta-ketoacyl-ACP synthase n=1 Tax=Sandaracinus amylolyticus TaxID=927083 RepID=UPI00069F7CC9|nr:beta-ketoacyl-ACP synthase [Sandaracinus amylolyticus]
MGFTPLPITAWSAVNALGTTTRDVLASLDAGRTGLAPPPFELPFPTFVGATPDPLPPLPRGQEAYDCRLARLGMLALDDVKDAVDRSIARWGAKRVAILIGTSTGGLDATELAFRHWVTEGRLPESFSLRTQHGFDALGELYARVTGIEGPTYVVSTACSSSGKVHASAARLIRAGLVDAALVGGIDSLCRMTLHGFKGLGILSEQRCRPFAKGRDGINIGEGAALMLLERDDAHQVSDPLRVHLLGVGESSDAYNMSSPEPQGRGAREAMQRAMEQAGMLPEHVDHLNAHGTATQQNDMSESLAIASLFGDRVPVVSTKGYTGHLLGAAGATEGVFAIHAVRTQRLPRALGSEELDPEIRIQVPLEGPERSIKRVLSNSFAFGGSNVCLAIGIPMERVS